MALYLSYAPSPAGNEIHDIRHYETSALSGRELRDDAFYEYPPVACGNGFRNSGEECDDGNKGDGDGCSATCQIESGYVCLGGNSSFVAADVCNLGSYDLRLSFEASDDLIANTAADGFPQLSSSSGDPTVFDASRWRDDVGLPVVEDTRYSGGGSAGGRGNRRGGNTVLTVGSKYARVGKNGLRVWVRNRFTTGEYAMSDAEKAATWTAATGGSAWQDLAGNNLATGGSMWTGKSGDTGAAEIHVARKTYTSLQAHSLLRVRLTITVGGHGCVHADPAQMPLFVALDVDGDTVFAQARRVLELDAGGSGKVAQASWRNTLQDGPAYGPTWVTPPGDDDAIADLPQSLHLGKGYTAWDAEGWSQPDGNFETSYNVDVAVPHSRKDGAVVSVWFVHGSDTTEGSCTLAAGQNAEWKVVQTTTNTPPIVATYLHPAGSVSPFRPWNPHATKGSGGGALTSSTPTTFSWIRFDAGRPVEGSDVLTYSFRVARWPQEERGFALEFMDAGHNGANGATPYDPGNSRCRSQGGCDLLTGCNACRDGRHDDTSAHGPGCQRANGCLVYYRVCYSWRGLPDWPCDETHRPPRGVWHDEAVDVFDKLGSRYGPDVTRSGAISNFRFQFVFASHSPYGRDADIEVHFDEIRLGGVENYEAQGASGCGTIVLESNTEITSSDATSHLGMRMEVDGTDFLSNANAAKTASLTSGFCTLQVAKLAELSTVSAADVHCLDPSVGRGFNDLVDGMADGDRMLVVSFGADVSCPSSGTRSCSASLERLGGIAVKWPRGSSLSFVGQKGAEPGAMPMQLELPGEGVVRVRPTFHCPNVQTEISEATAQGGQIGPTLSRLNRNALVDARFTLDDKPSGYLGCFRDRNGGGQGVAGEHSYYILCSAVFNLERRSMCLKPRSVCTLIWVFFPSLSPFLTPPVLPPPPPFGSPSKQTFGSTAATPTTSSHLRFAPAAATILGRSR